MASAAIMGERSYVKESDGTRRPLPGFVPSSNRSTNPAGSEFFSTLQEMRRDWMARATAEIELSLKLSKKLTAADSVPDAVAACQEWLNEEMSARAEDARSSTVS